MKQIIRRTGRQLRGVHTPGLANTSTQENTILENTEPRGFWFIKSTSIDDSLALTLSIRLQETDIRE